MTIIGYFSKRNETGKVAFVATFCGTCSKIEIKRIKEELCLKLQCLCTGKYENYENFKNANYCINKKSVGLFYYHLLKSMYLDERLALRKQICSEF